MKKSLLGTLALLSIQTAIAMPPKPANCPSIQALQSTPIDAMQLQNNQWYGVDLDQTFGTPEKWFFVLPAGTATDEDNAFQNAQKSLASLNFIDGPQYIEMFDMWSCSYNTEFGVATAATPFPVAIKNMTHFIK